MIVVSPLAAITIAMSAAYGDVNENEKKSSSNRGDGRHDGNATLTAMDGVTGDGDGAMH